MTHADYLHRVGSALDDLPWRQRQELLAELRGHLADFPADTDLTERLGTPEQYAADLRAAEGLERRRGVIAFLRARRPRNVVITVVAVVLIGLAIGTAVWVQNYQPLADNGFPLLPATAHIDPDGNAETVLARPGGPFQLGLLLQNTGRFAVRVLGVPIAGPFVTRLQMVGPFKGYGYLQRPGHYKAFHHFDLEPGSNVILRLRGVYAKCGTYPGQVSGTGTGYPTITDFPVRYSFLWRTSTATIPLAKKLTILELCS